MSAPLMVLDVELVPDPDEPDVLQAETALGVVRVHTGDQFSSKWWELEVGGDVECAMRGSAYVADVATSAHDADTILRRLRNVVATPLRSEIASLEAKNTELRSVIELMSTVIEAQRALTPTPAVEHVSRELSAEDAAEAER